MFCIVPINAWISKRARLRFIEYLPCFWLEVLSIENRLWNPMMPLTISLIPHQGIIGPIRFIILIIGCCNSSLLAGARIALGHTWFTRVVTILLNERCPV